MEIGIAEIYAVGTTTIILIFFVLCFWLGKPLMNLIKQKMNPSKYSKIIKHMLDGSEVEELYFNPKEIKSTDANFAKDQQKIIAGTIIKGTFARDRNTGVPIHHVFEGEMENRNLLASIPASVESKLLNQTIIGAYQAGKLDQATETQKKDSMWTIQNIICMLLILALFIMIALTVQNQDLLKVIATQTATVASKVVAG